MSVLVAGILFLLYFTTITNQSNHLCDRPCIKNQANKDCYFIFKLQAYISNHIGACKDCYYNEEKDCYNQHCITLNGKNRTFLSINNKFPGPQIKVCQGDNVRIEVQNRLPGHSEVSIHWHGIRQLNYPYMDGVAMITQCPIPSGADFIYQFIANDIGTHFYHANSVLQQIDGIIGPFIIKSYEEEKYEDDITLTITPWYNQMLTGVYGVIKGNLQTNYITPDALLLNGKGAVNIDGEIKQLARLSVKNKSLLRIINAAPIDCPIDISISQHIMKVIRVGGDLINPPINVKSILIYPGERYDVEVKSNEIAGNYVLEIIGKHICENTPKLDAIFNVKFSTFEANNQKLDYEKLSSDCNDTIKSFCSLNLQRKELEIKDEEEKIDYIYNLPFGHLPVREINENDLEFRYVLEDISYYPTFLTDKTGIIFAPHLNNVTFRLPASPLLIHEDDEEALSKEECESYPIIDNNTISRVRRPSGTCQSYPDYCECTHIIRIPSNSTVQFTLIHSVMNDKEGSYSVHLHGHLFKVIKWKNINNDWNYVKNGIYRDTVPIPYNGAVTIQFNANNPGFWLLEARAGHVASAGVSVAVVLQIGDRTQFTKIPNNFPRCSGIRMDDVIF